MLPTNEWVARAASFIRVRSTRNAASMSGRSLFSPHLGSKVGAIVKTQGEEWANRGMNR